VGDAKGVKYGVGEGVTEGGAAGGGSSQVGEKQGEHGLDDFKLWFCAVNLLKMKHTHLAAVGK
jgi:hypothetical protein